MREVAFSRLGRGTIVGVFQPARQLATFSPPNMPNLGGAINYRPYASHLFEVASHVKTAISAIIINYIYYTIAYVRFVH